MDITCEDCQKQIQINRLVEPKHHHFLCKECITNREICSLDKCKKRYLLNDDDMNKLKHIYVDNPKNKKKFFIFSDVRDIIIEKFGSVENMDTIKKQREMDDRKRLLTETLEYNKLEYKSYGDCFSYVKYGRPSIETVISNELKKLETKRNRKMILANELATHNIPFDETLPSCYNYINNIGCKTLNETISEIRVEQYMKNNTNYNRYLEKLDPIRAKRLAKNDISQKSIRIRFD